MKNINKLNSRIPNETTIRIYVKPIYVIKIEKFKAILNEKIVNIEELKNLAWYGIPTGKLFS